MRTRQVTIITVDAAFIGDENKLKVYCSIECIKSRKLGNKSVNFGRGWDDEQWVYRLQIMWCRVTVQVRLLGWTFYLQIECHYLTNIYICCLVEVRSVGCFFIFFILSILLSYKNMHQDHVHVPRDGPWIPDFLLKTSLPSFQRNLTFKSYLRAPL